MRRRARTSERGAAVVDFVLVLLVLLPLVLGILQLALVLHVRTKSADRAPLTSSSTFARPAWADEPATAA